MKIRKINMASVKETAKNAFTKGKTFVKDAPKNIKTLAHDTVDFVKHNPKQAGVYVLAGAGALATLAVVKEIAKAGIEKVQARKYE